MPWSLSVPPENIRKPLVLMFSGGIKETSGMKWLNDVMTNLRTVIMKTTLKSYTI